MAEETLETSTGILSFLFDFTHSAITRNAADLTHAESIVAPPTAGNCANWVLGHIVSNRGFVLELVHEQPLWGPGEGDFYERLSKPLDPKVAFPFERLLADLAVTHERLKRGLARLDPAELDAKHAEEAKRPRGAQLHFANFHESYHAGQLGILRRMAGKPGAI